MQFADFDCAKRAIYIIALNYFEGSDADGALAYAEKPVPGELPFCPGRAGQRGRSVDEACLHAC